MFRLIKKFIPEIHALELNDLKTKNNFIHYDLFNKKEKKIAYLKLAESGDLLNYVCFNEPLIHLKTPLSETEIIKKANEFLNTFYPKTNLVYSSVSFDAHKYQVNYEKKDSEYNLYLPETGIRIIVNEVGRILSFEIIDKSFEIIYPENIRSEKEAKAAFLSYVNLDLKITKPLNHDNYRLVYKINEDINEVPASFKKPELNIETQKLISMEAFTTSSENIYRILGLDANYTKIGKKNIKDYRIELWSKYPKKSFFDLNYDINEPQIDLIKYKIHKHTQQIVQICAGDIYLEDDQEVISNAKAFDRALDFLFTLYPKADEVFDILELSTDPEDELDQEYEDNYVFYFNRVHDSIAVENQIAYIGVGKYTGMINKYCAPTVTEKELKHINVFAKVSEPEAMKLYEEKLEMNLTFIKKEDKKNNITYHLAYIPTFRNGKDTANLIDAHEGVMYEN